MPKGSVRIRMKLDAWTAGPLFCGLIGVGRLDFLRLFIEPILQNTGCKTTTQTEVFYSRLKVGRLHFPPSTQGLVALQKVVMNPGKVLLA